MNDSRREWEEKEIRERWFPNHVAEYSVLTDGDCEIERLRWHRPGTSNRYIEYWYRSGTLHVHGDLEEAIYRWAPDIGSLRDLAGLHLDYFEGKCNASRSGRNFKAWDGDVAEDYLKRRFEDYPEEKAIFDDNDGDEAINSKEEWVDWLEEYGIDCFGPDWLELARIGEVIDMCCHAHLIGLKMAFAQLKAEEAAA